MTDATDGDKQSVDETAELADRFSNNRSQQPASADESLEASETNEANEASDTDGTTETNESNDASDASDASGSGNSSTAVRNRLQTAMYLPPEQRQDVEALYEQLDARSKLAGTGAVTKHGEFFEAFVAVALDHDDEIAERLGVELPDE